MIRIGILSLTVILLSINCDLTAQTTTTPLNTKPQINPATLFSGERAMVDLVKQVEFGPRLPNSPGIQATRKLIIDTLTGAGWDVGTQDFSGHSALLNQTVNGQNIFAVYPKNAKVKYLLSAHYDTRPYADMDPDPARRMDPVPGANDGASGVAVLLEIARALPQTNINHGIALVFYDLEDHGAPSSNESFCVGSRYFADHLPAQVKDFQYGINLDMIGDADLLLPMEGYSLDKAPKLTFDLWNLGNSLFPDVWAKKRGPSIYDDHMPFLGAGHKFIDVIDIQYPAWHTTGDTPDKCSAKSLDIVGDTVISFILR